MKLRFLTLFFLVMFLFTPSKIFAKQISITCSLFPVYDFTREIVKDNAEVKLILRPGVEPHEFEPSPMDIKALNDSDVFIFTGKNMEGWAEKISSSLTFTKIIDASKNIELINNDPHIWLDLNRAEIMVENILEGICEADNERAEIYKLNARNFLLKLSGLDEKFMGLKKNKSLVFAGEFSCNYFMKRYGFEYVSAYDGENEPSVKRMAEILKYIRENNVRYIFSDAGEILPVTKSISEQTQTEILIFNSLHKVTDKKTFLQNMKDNYENIKIAVDD